VFKRVGKPAIFILVIVIAAISYLAIFGVHSYNGDIKQTVIAGVQDIRFGIDIRGGVDVTFTPPAGTKVTSADMTAMVQRLSERMDSLGIKDRDIYPDYSHNRIDIRFPWKSDVAVKDQDAETAISELAATSELYFKDSSGNTFMTGKDVQSAKADVDNNNNGVGYDISLTFKDTGVKKFAAATKKAAAAASGKNTISIYLDNKLLQTASVDSEIDSSTCIIDNTSNPLTKEYCADIASKINAGALPFKLVTDNYSAISPTMGQNALYVTVLAGLIAFILICLFMILYYRLPGLIACIALIGHITATLLCISIPQFTLTLPGIAGIILSIGMGVDCNIITAERIKEELRVGKTLDGAIDAGFERSFTAIFDGNITVIIVGILLWIFGSGTVQSFGYTLIIGVIFNFIMGLTFSRMMLKSISKFPGVRKNWLFGGASK
jgi:protein-export membrane protein, SecD/SecF family